MSVRRGGGQDGQWIIKDVMMAFGTEGIAPVRAAMAAGRLCDNNVIVGAIARLRYLERDTGPLQRLLAELDAVSSADARRNTPDGETQ